MNPGTSDWAGQLRAGLEEMGLSLPGEARDQLVRYLALLQKWNQAFNLTAVRDPNLWVSRHLLDSLSLLPYLPEGPVLDVGTGAGLPGIPLAIARPGQSFTLVDSNGKKTRFCTQAKGELGLDNLEVRHCRIEDLGMPDRYAAICSRAFAELGRFLELTRPWAKADAQWLALKGIPEAEELAQVEKGYKTERISLRIPNEAAARELVRITETEILDGAESAVDTWQD